MLFSLPANPSSLIGTSPFVDTQRTTTSVQLLQLRQLYLAPGDCARILSTSLFSRTSVRRVALHLFRLGSTHVSKQSFECAQTARQGTEFTKHGRLQESHAIFGTLCMPSSFCERSIRTRSRHVEDTRWGVRQQGAYCR